jgi:hypothetical protein
VPYKEVKVMPLKNMPEGWFISYMKAGETVRRECWPNDVKIYLNFGSRKIIRYDGREHTYWMPTHFDLMANDWEVV